MSSADEIYESKVSIDDLGEVGKDACGLDQRQLFNFLKCTKFDKSHDIFDGDEFCTSFISLYLDRSDEEWYVPMTLC